MHDCRAAARSAHPQCITLTGAISAFALTAGFRLDHHEHPHACRFRTSADPHFGLPFDFSIRLCSAQRVSSQRVFARTSFAASI